MADLKQVVVTTGATVTFEKLIKETLDLDFLNLLIELGFNSLVVQFGKKNEAKELILKLLPFEQYSETKSSTSDYIIKGEFKNLKLKCIPFDTDLIGNYICNSAMVISHAGTGSIMDTLRTNDKIKLVVMVNESLLDNHQRETADAFESLGVLKSVCGKERIIDVVRGLEPNFPNGKLPSPNGRIIGQIIREELFD